MDSKFQICLVIAEFGELYNKRTSNHFSSKINKKFIVNILDN